MQINMQLKLLKNQSKNIRIKTKVAKHIKKLLILKDTKQESKIDSKVFLCKSLMVLRIFSITEFPIIQEL